MPTVARYSRTRSPRDLLAAAATASLLFAAAPCANPPAFAAASAEARTAERALAQGSIQPQYTIQARVPLTIVDVTVTDAKGNPVHGLKQSDFTIFEDKQEMKPNSFEEHRTDEAAPAPTLIKQDLPPNTFTNAIPAPSKSLPINILLIDDLNTQMQAQQQIVQRMLEMVARMPSGTQMAVFRLTTHLSILQGITTNPELVRAALNSKEAAAQMVPVADPDAAGTGGNINVESAHTALRGQYTLDAMRQIARYLSGMPGRKNLIWFTASFPLKFPPVTDPYAFPPPCSCTYMEGDDFDFGADLKSAADVLTRAHTAIYAIDGRGIQAPDLPVLSPASTTKLTNRMNMRNAEHETMDTLAELTGGKATYTSNDFAGAVLDAIDLGSNFYTITYEPTNQALDTRFRTITVKVDQPGLHLDYRNGYYAVDPTIDAHGKKIETVSPMQAAMMRGALDATQILFKVKAVQFPGTEVSLPIHNMPNPKQMKPPYRHYSITYTIDIHSIQFAPLPDGNYHAAFEYGIRVYNATGDEIVNSAGKEAHPILTPAIYQSMLKTGAVAHDEIDVPAKGDYFLRIAVHDLATDRVGSMEIPVSSIKADIVPAVASGSNP